MGIIRIALAIGITFLITHGLILAQADGDSYLFASLKKLQMLQTIECDIRIETSVNGKEYTARGRYEEQAFPQSVTSPFLRTMHRLDIFFPMDAAMSGNAEPNRMTLVCYAADEGRQQRVERYTCLEGVRSFKTINLTELEKWLKENNRDRVFAQVGEVRNLGGLSGMLRQINRFYEFSAPTQETLPAEGSEKSPLQTQPIQEGQTQEGVPIPARKFVGALRGIYHKELLARFGGLQQGGTYPDGFPSHMEIWLGQINDFPYKIRYLRQISEKSAQRELIFQESFFQVKLNGMPIPVSRFAPLTPPNDVLAEDETDAFIKSLGL